MAAIADTTGTGVVTIRPARVDDIPMLADLLRQLYDAELPGALTGAPDHQRRLLRFTLEAQPNQALQHRYVLCNADDQVLATGMIQFPTEPPFERAPAGTVRMAVTLLGYWAVGRLLLTIARSMIGIYPQRLADTVLLHSVVVDARYRGQGLGRCIVNQLEQIATEQGYQAVVLQVLADNAVARRFYLDCGYQEIWCSPRWVTMLNWSSYVLRKALKRE